MQVFVPLDEDTIDQLNHQDALVPYQAGLLSVSQIAGPAAEDAQSRSSTSSSPGSAPSSAALPALSSSTYRAGPALG